MMKLTDSAQINFDGFSPTPQAPVVRGHEFHNFYSPSLKWSWSLLIVPKSMKTFASDQFKELRVCLTKYRLSRRL